MLTTKGRREGYLFTFNGIYTMAKLKTLLAVQGTLIVLSLCLDQIVTILMKWFVWRDIRMMVQGCGILAVGIACVAIIYAKKASKVSRVPLRFLGVVGIVMGVGFFRTPVTGLQNGSVARLLMVDGASEELMRAYVQLASTTDLDGYTSKVLAKSDLPRGLERVFSRLGVGNYTVRAIEGFDGQLYFRITYPLFGAGSLVYFLGATESLERFITGDSQFKMVWKHLYVGLLEGM